MAENTMSATLRPLEIEHVEPTAVYEDMQDRPQGLTLLLGKQVVKHALIIDASSHNRRTDRPFIRSTNLEQRLCGAKVARALVAPNTIQGGRLLRSL